MGRPPSENPKDVYTHVRQTRQERDAWRATARAHGMKMTEFLRQAVAHYTAFLKKRGK